MKKWEGFAGQRLVVVPRPVLTTALQHPLLRHLLRIRLLFERTI